MKTMRRRQLRELEPKTDRDARRGSLSAFRRLDVIDKGCNVVLRGSSADDLIPVVASLEADLALEVGPVLACHDFSKHPVAAGMVGSDRVWRMVRVGASGYFGVLVERSAIARRAAALARRFALGAQDAELLRLTAGGYRPEEIARRFGREEATIDEQRERLVKTLGCATLREIVEMVETRRPDDAHDVLSRFSELPQDWQRLSSF
jgi:DNA-binding CsgD family transcriptional regulator